MEDGICLTLELEPGSGPIRGCVWEDEEPHPFEGWLQLTNLLELLRPSKEGDAR